MLSLVDQLSFVLLAGEEGLIYCNSDQVCLVELPDLVHWLLQQLEPLADHKILVMVAAGQI